MEVVLYRVKGTSGYIYDMSFNPEVDYVVLKRTRKIQRMDILTGLIKIDTAINILKKLYGSKIFHKRILTSQNYIFDNLLRKYKIDKIRKNFKYEGSIPSNDDVSKVENVIIGKVMSIRKILSIAKNFGCDEKKCMDIIQILYCERRIKISSFLKDSCEDVCSMCNKKLCSKCCFGFESKDVLIYAADNYNVKEPKKVEVVNINNISDSEKKIASFLKTRKQFLVLFCTPNSYDFSVLAHAVSDVVGSGGRVLYITSTMRLMEAKEAFTSNIKGISACITNGFKPSYRDYDMTICSYENYPCFHKSFDIVILDYIYAFADNPAVGMLPVSQKAVKEGGKFIYITTIKEKWKSSVLKGQAETIPLLRQVSGKPVVEPRIVISRFLNDEEPFIPPMVMDIIKWSLSSSIKVVIFVPDETGIKKVYYYLTRNENMDGENIDVSIDSDRNSFIKFRKGEVNIYITMNIKDALIPMGDVNVIVMYSDNMVFNAGTLVGLASIADKNSKNALNSREVVFVGFEESEAMSLAKMSIRAINKAGWDMGYFKE